MATQVHSSSTTFNSNADSESFLTQLEEGAKQTGQEQQGSLTNPNNGGTNAERPWDRAITKEELRNASLNWSLAGDAGLLHYLQDFSQRMFSRTHELDKIMDTLVYDTKGLDCKVQNTFNDFLMLSNTQFVENRVYDEEISQEETGNDKEETPKPVEKTREQLESEVLPRFSQAVSLGLQVLDDAFITVEIKPEEESDEEEGEPTLPQSMVADPIIEPKDVYADRPLPHLIGTAEFFHDETVGLIEELSDDEKEKKEEEEGSETETEPDELNGNSTESESELTESSDEEFANRAGKPPKASISGSEEEDEDEDEDLFGEKKTIEESDSDVEPLPKSDLQSELASKLGLPAKNQTKKDNSYGDDQSVISKASADTASIAASVESSGTSRQGKKHSKSVGKTSDGHSQKHRSGSKKHHKKEEPGEEDLFSTQPDDSSPFGEAFGQKSGLFSGGGTLFDDNEEEGDLFGETPTKTEDHVPKVEETPEPVEIKPRTRTTSTGKKLPAGAVSIFGGLDSSPLFGKEEPISEENKSEEKLEKHNVEKTIPPPVKGLFDDEEDDGGLFDQIKPKQDTLKVDTPVPRKRTLELFDDEDEDVFAGKSKTSTDEVSKEDKKSKKVPVGGVSVFGDALSGKESDKIKKREETTTSSKVDTGPPGLFDDETTAKAPEKTSTKPVKPKSQTVISLFDDDEHDDTGDDLFSSLSAPKEKAKPSKNLSSETKTTAPGTDDTMKTEKAAPPQASKKKFSGLFDDEDDDLFATPAVPSSKDDNSDTKGEVKQKKATTTAPKVKSLFVEDQDEGLFGDSKDLFPTAPKVKVSPVTQENSSVAVKKTNPPSKAPMLADSESDDDAIFSTKKEKVIKDQISNATRENKIDTENATGGTSDSLTDKATKKEDATGKKENKLGGLFDEQDSDQDDFFSDASSKMPPKKDDLPGDIFSIKKESALNTEVPVIPGDGANSQPPSFTTSKPSAKTRTPPGGVSLFGGIDPFAEKQSYRQPESHDKDKTSVDKDEIDSASHLKTGTKQTVAENPLPKTAAKPSDGEAVGKLQKSINFNPAALLPGASPPQRKLEATEASFENPPEIRTLENAGKERVRVKAKRRPPTRGARKNAAKASETLFSNSASSNLEKSSSSNSAPLSSSSDLIFGPPSLSGSRDMTDDTDFPSDILSKSNEDSSDDIFSEPSAAPSNDIFSKASMPKKTAEKALGNTSSDIFGEKVDDDIFGYGPSGRAPYTKSATDSIFDSNSDSSKPNVEETISKSDTPILKESEDEDLFSSNRSNEIANTKDKANAARSNTKSPPEGNSSTKTEEKSDVAPTKKAKKEETKKSPKKSVKKRDDDDLFGESGSIFDDLPASKSKEKKKKKSPVSDDIFSSEDIFSSPKTTKEKKTKTKKKAEKATKTTKTVFDDNAPSIFDDPLNALGGD